MNIIPFLTKTWCVSTYQTASETMVRDQGWRLSVILGLNDLWARVVKLGFDQMCANTEAGQLQRERWRCVCRRHCRAGSNHSLKWQLPVTFITLGQQQQGGNLQVHLAEINEDTVKYVLYMSIYMCVHSHTQRKLSCSPALSHLIKISFCMLSFHHLSLSWRSGCGTFRYGQLIESCSISSLLLTGPPLSVIMQ